MRIKIVFNDKLLDRIGVFMKIGGITLWPWIILRERYNMAYLEKQKERVIRHEMTHIKQQAEMLVLPFYIWYVVEYILKLFKYGSKAYRNLSFEREAYANEHDLEYINNRKAYAWMKYIFKG